MKLQKLAPLGLVALVMAGVLVSVKAVSWLSTRPNRVPVRLSQHQVEQNAFQVVQGWAAPADVTNVKSRRTTLGQLLGPPACSALERAWRKTLVILGNETYDPCDSTSLLWVVELDGLFSFPGGLIRDHAQVVYDATGHFIRADSP